MRSLLLLALTVLVSTSGVTALRTCEDFQRCSECVYDAFESNMAKQALRCAWCPAVNGCRNDTSCSGALTIAKNSQCPDMQCRAASLFNNIYICRFGAAFFIFVGAVLLFDSVVFAAWLNCLWQKPWRFPNILDALDELPTAPKPPLLRLRTRCDKGACPVCKVHHDRVFGPGQVCYWCDVTRRAFFPFALGTVSAVVALVTLFALSLRPSFADWYYSLLLFVPILAHGIFAAYVMNNQVPIVGDLHNRPTAFFSLALTLRFRALDAVFEVPVDEATEPAPEPITPPIIPSLMAEETMAFTEPDRDAAPPTHEAFHVDTLHMLELDTTVPSAFRKRLKEDLKHDEFIVWWEKPAPSQVHVENRWLLHIFGVGVVTGVYCFIVGGLPESGFPRVLLSGEALRFIGLILVVVSAGVFAAVYAGSERVHVLTNKRLLMLTNGMLGSVHPWVTPLDHVGYATVWGYQELGYSVTGFSWETADAKPRKLPRVGMTSFVGVQNCGTLLQLFREHAPAIKTKKAHIDRRKQQAAWRLHVTVNFALVVVAPIVIIASEVLPTGVAFVGLLLWWNIHGAVLHRAWRVLSTTSSPVTSKGSAALGWKEWNQSGFSVRKLFSFGRAARDAPEGKKKKAEVL